MHEYSFAKKFVDLPMKTHFTSNDLSINLFSANIKVCIATVCVNDLILANFTLAKKRVCRNQVFFNFCK